VPQIRAQLAELLGVLILIPACFRFSNIGCSLFVWMALAVPTTAQLPVPQLHSLSPIGVQRGNPIVMTVGGADLVDVRELRFSDPNIKASLQQNPADPLTGIVEPKWGNFDVQIPAEQPVGIYEAWVVSALGISNSRRFVVDSLPVLNDPGNNSTTATAPAIALPQAIAGRCDSAVIDYYRIDLNAGDTIQIECWAKQIDSRVTPLLSIQNAAGRELTLSRGSDSVDPSLQFTAPAQGSYFVAIRDFLLEGGGNSFYWLRIQPGTAVSEIRPSIVKGGEQVAWKGIGSKPSATSNAAAETIEVSAGNLAIPAEPISWFMHPRIPWLRPSSVAVPLLEVANPTGLSSLVGWAPASAKCYPDITASTNPADATVLEVPAEVSGVFASQAKDLFFRFNATKGTKYYFDVVSTRLSRTADPILAIGRITTPETPISWLATIDDPANREGTRKAEFDLLSDDPSGEFTIPEDGTYVVRLRNQYRSLQNSHLHYRLSIRAGIPDFSLFAAMKQLKKGGDQQSPLFAPNLVRGGSLPLQILVQRNDGFNGEIVCRVENLPAGVTAGPLVIPAGRNDGWLVMSASLEAQPSMGSIKIIGESKVGEAVVTRTALPLMITWDSPDRNQTPAYFRATSQLMLSVCDQPMRVSLTARSEQLTGDPASGNARIVLKPGDELKMTFKAVREGGFAGEVKARQQGLPDPWMSPEIVLAPDASEVTWMVKIPAEKSEGIYNLFFRGDLQIPYQPNPALVARVTAKKEKLVQLQQTTQKEKEEATTAAAQDKIAAADARLAEINMRIAEVDKQLEEANKANAVQNKDVAIWTNSFTLEVKVPTP
jgi:hypothetical protein